jgi:hypothetical protein
MIGLPTKYAKMGFKRGWKAFKKLKRHSLIKKGVSTMARKRRGGFRRSIKKHYRRAKSGFSMGNITKILAGAALACVFEVFVSPMIPLDGLVKNIVELGIGIALASMSGMPTIIRAGGVALATINAFMIIQPYISGMGAESGNANIGWN